MSTVAYEAPTEAPTARKRMGAAALSLLLILCLALGGALAYLTDAKQIVNNLVLDTDLRIELTEPEWDAAREADPSYAKNLVPTETAVKDPTVTCTGTVPAYAAVKVCVPVFTGKVFDQAAGTIEDMSDADLFTIAWEDGWVLKETSEVADGYRTYTYLWPTALNQGDSAKVFGSVTVANLIEGAGIDATQITVDAFGIQAEGFADADAAWAGYTHQEGDGAGEAPDPGPGPDEPTTALYLDDAITVMSTLSNLIKDGNTTSVSFIRDDIDGANGTDVSAVHDGSIVAYNDEASATTVVAAEDTILTQPNADWMLYFDCPITEFDFSNLSFAETDSANYLIDSQHVDTLTLNDDGLLPATYDNMLMASGNRTYHNNGIALESSQTCDSLVPLPGKNVKNVTKSYTLEGVSLGDNNYVSATASVSTENVTKIHFCDYVEQGAQIYHFFDLQWFEDLELETSGIVCWMSSDKTELYVSSGVKGQKIVAAPYLFDNYGDHWESFTFHNCGNVTSIDGFEHLDTSAMTSATGMFSACGSLKSLDLAALDFSSVTDTTFMFQNCSGLESVTMPATGLSKLGKAANTFANCTGLRNVTFSENFTINPSASYINFPVAMKAGGITYKAFDKIPTGANTFTRA